MNLFGNLFKNNKPNFTEIDSNEKAIELANKGILEPLYLMPLRFNGEESAINRVFVPSFAVELKDRCDDFIEKMVIEEKVQGYSCNPEYKGNSFIPSKIKVVVTNEGKEVFSQTIEIW